MKNNINPYDLGDVAKHRKIKPEPKLKPLLEPLLRGRAVVACRAHNPKVESSNLSPATKNGS